MKPIINVFLFILIAFTYKVGYSQFSTITEMSLAFSNANSFPEEFTEFNGWVYFSAESDFTGRELWRTDGTPNGTELFADIGNFDKSGEPTELAVFQGYLYFTANNGIDGAQLWRTDGTITGTEMVTSFSYVPTGFSYGSIKDITVFNNSLFFWRSDGISGVELWKSDGTAAGTNILKDINPGFESSYGTGFFSNGTDLFFIADDGTHGNELWKTDGTEPGTVLVKDIYPGSNSGFTNIAEIDDQVVISNNLLFFTATDGVNGKELWRSDGSELGTFMVSDILPGTNGSSPKKFAVNGNNVFFIAFHNTVNNKGLWYTDGTAAGTHIISTSMPQYPMLCVTEDNAFFSRADASTGVELYKVNSDGTGSPALIKDISEGETSSNPENLCEYGSYVYFKAVDEDGGELWRTDGTELGTTQVKDIHTGFLGSSPFLLTVCNDLLFFCARQNSLFNFEPYVSDGTTAGTINLRNIYHSENNQSDPLLWEEHSIYKDNLYLCDKETNSDLIGYELYRSGGTINSTELFADLQPGIPSSAPRNFIEINDYLFFNNDINLDNNFGLVRTDGSQLNTTVLETSTDIVGMGEANNKLVYFKQVSMNISIWICDVNSTPVFLMTLNNSDMYNDQLYTHELITINNLLYFTLNNNTYGTELWRTDGTVAGTYRLKDINLGTASSYPQYLTEHNGLLYFSAESGAAGMELWVSDGTSLGTNLFKDINVGIESGNPKYIVSMEDKIYFSAFTEEYGQELWVSDGTEIGTLQCDDIEIGAASSNPRDLTKGLNGLYFSARTQVNGRELWIKKDNLPTELVVDLIPGIASSNPSSLKLINNVIYFAGNDGLHGYEPYSTLGSECSTFMLQDVYPGDKGSHPRFYGAVNGRLLFAAGNQAVGWEIFASNSDFFQADTVYECQQYYWPLINDTLENSGFYSTILQDTSGCDSLVSLSLVIGHPVTTVDHITACTSYTWIDGIEYTSSNSTATHVLTSITGCDSTVTLNLVIEFALTQIDTITSYSSYYWEVADTTYEESGVYTTTVTNAVGCDSIYIIHLTIQPDTSTVVFSCGSYFWSETNQTYTNSGIYTTVVQNQQGQDSLAILDLTIYNSTFSTDIQMICDSYTWIDGVTYYNSINGPTWTIENSNGCDSVVTLDLTIIPFTVPPVVENVFSSPSEPSTCNGEFNIEISGNGTFEIELDNSLQPSSYTTYASFPDLCAGVHELRIINVCGDFTEVTFVVPVDTNFVFNNPLPDSIAVDSLGNTTEDCQIYYNEIDTAYIDSAWVTGNTVHVIWNIVDTSGSNYFTSTYEFNKGNGVYWVQLDLFCLSNPMEDFFTVTEAIYFEDGDISTAGINDWEDLNVQIYPNPTNDLVTITFDGNQAELTIYDTQGKLIKQAQVMQTGTQVSLKDAQTGIYFFELKTLDGKAVKRVAKN